VKKLRTNTEVHSFLVTANEKSSNRELRLFYDKINFIFENVNGYVFLLDLTGKIIDVNEAALKLTRRLKEDLIGKHFVKYVAIDSEVKTQSYDVLRKMLFGERLSLKTRFKNKNNQNIVIETSASHIRHYDKAVGILIIARDVTEQKMAEEETRYEAEKYRSLVENAQDVIVTFDLKDNLTSANKAIENYGFKIRDITGKNMLEFVSGKYWPKVMADVAKISRGKAIKSELEVITPIGKRMAEYQSNPVMNGKKVVGIQTVLRDITERKIIEEKLAESEECYRVLFEKSPIGICMMAVNGRIINVNKKMEVITGYNSAELMKMSFLDLCKDSVAVKTLKTIDGQDAVREMQTQVKCKDGKLIQVLLNASKIQLRNSSFIQIRIQDMSELVMTEKRLSASEKKYRTLFEEAMDAIFVADAETGILLDCNRAACQLVGREKTELIGKHQSILHPPTSIEGKFSRTFRLHRTEKEGQILEDRVVTKDGEIKKVSIKANIFELENRKVLMGIFRDITEQKRIEEELVQERDFLQALMDNIPDTIYFKDIDSKFTKVNKAQATVLGISDPKEAIGKTDFDFFTPEHAGDAFDDEQRIIKTGQPLIGKIEKIRRADGQFRWVSATKTPIRNKQGKIIGLVGISRDITEQRQIEEKMEYQKNLFDALMDNMPDSIYFKDTQSRFVRVSKVSCAGMGIKNPDEAVGMTDFDWAPKELAEQYYVDDQTVMKTGMPIIGKEEVSISKVGKKWYSATKVPIRDKKGNVIGLVGISRDITKLKETEEALRHYSLHLEEIVEERTRKLREAQRLATIGETAAMVGHDLRNPLQAIAAVPYLVEKALQTLPKQVEEAIKKSSIPTFMNMLQEQTLYMNKIVSDLQDYARPVKLNLKETNLYSMLEDVLSTVNVAENIEVSIEIARDMLAVFDPHLLRRVFTNLINNAVQAMPEGGKLTIRATQNGDGVCISFQDTGVGIPEENLSKIFQPLFTTKAKGQGLGLPVCKRIMEAHGGKITVTSKLHVGSTFTVHIPFKKEVEQDE